MGDLMHHVTCAPARLLAECTLGQDGTRHSGTRVGGADGAGVRMQLSRVRVYAHGDYPHGLLGGLWSERWLHEERIRAGGCDLWGALNATQQRETARAACTVGLDGTSSPRVWYHCRARDQVKHYIRLNWNVA